MKTDRPFWEISYSKQDAPTTFNKGKPSWDVIEVLEKHLNGGKILALGCGDGRNALYAAKLGYDVTATDISQSGISKLLKSAVGMNAMDGTVDRRAFSPNKLTDMEIRGPALSLNRELIIWFFFIHRAGVFQLHPR